MSVAGGIVSLVQHFLFLIHLVVFESPSCSVCGVSSPQSFLTLSLAWYVGVHADPRCLDRRHSRVVISGIFRRRSRDRAALEDELRVQSK